MRRAVSTSLLVAAALTAVACGAAPPPSQATEPSPQTTDAPPSPPATAEPPAVASAETDAVASIVGELASSGDEVRVSLGTRPPVRVRYVEQLREAEGENVPRVSATLELEQADATWTPLVELYCHDSYDDCGTLEDELSCPVIEASQLYWAPLAGLIGGVEQDPARARELVDALGARTPLALCFARLHQHTPHHLGSAFETYGIALEDTELQALFDRAMEADALWRDDRERALALVREVGARLADVAPSADLFGARYVIDAIEANHAGRYPTPIVGPGGALVRSE